MRELQYHRTLCYGVSMDAQEEDVEVVPCTVEDCEKPQHGKTYCRSHLSIYRQFGTTEKPPCEVDGCEKPRHGNTYCQAHYRLYKKHGKPETLAPEDRQPPGPKPDPSKPRSRYGPSRLAEGTIRKYLVLGGVCPAGHLLTEETTYRYMRSDKERVVCRLCSQVYGTGKGRLNKYNLTEEQYEQMLENQDWACAICDLPFDGSTKTSTPHIDHDHSCCGNTSCCGECVRGVLCDGCNKALGLFEDDLWRVKRAVAYLER